MTATGGKPKGDDVAVKKQQINGLLAQLADDLGRQNYSPKTRKAYCFCVGAFLKHHRSLQADQLNLDHVRTYQLYLTKKKAVSPSYFNQAMSALKFFYSITLEQEWNVKRVPCKRKPKRLPVVLDKEEVLALFRATTNLKHRTILMTIYGCGLRLNEVRHLEIRDIDGKRMMVHVRMGKGNRDRYVMLSRRLYKALRLYWAKTVPHPQRWLFPGKNPEQPVSRTTIQEIFTKARKKAGITKRASVHTLRHSFATHLLEDGTNLIVIQRLLGHRSLRSTLIYVHVARTMVASAKSPLDTLVLTSKNENEEEDKS
jgi:site-specific recombinase XerD|tara:strand:- start:674 stop:1612 length:939 start_codon:yes stop_codon:yes gene_type:complete